MVRLFLPDTFCGTFTFVLCYLAFFLFVLVSLMLDYGLVLVWTASEFNDFVAADGSDVPLVCEFVMIFVDSDPL